jgi:hypothetical protein
MRVSLCIFMALVSLVSSRRLHAQGEELLYDPRDITSGLLVGARGTAVPGTSATGKGQSAGTDLATTWGSGGGLIVGYGSSPRLLFFASVDYSTHESDNAQIAGDITLWHFDFGARFHLHLPNVRYVPYVSLAAGGKQLYTREFIDTLGVARPATINARAIVPGAGMQVFLLDNFAIDGQVAVSIGSFGRINMEGNRRRLRTDGGVTTRVMIGVNWYPDD